MRVRQAREAADAERLRLEKEARLQKKREAKAKAKAKEKVEKEAARQQKQQDAIDGFKFKSTNSNLDEFSKEYYLKKPISYKQESGGRMYLNRRDPNDRSKGMNHYSGGYDRDWYIKEQEEFLRSSIGENKGKDFDDHARRLGRLFGQGTDSKDVALQALDIEKRVVKQKIKEQANEEEDKRKASAEKRSRRKKHMDDVRELRETGENTQYSVARVKKDRESRLNKTCNAPGIIANKKKMSISRVMHIDDHSVPGGRFFVGESMDPYKEPLWMGSGTSSYDPSSSHGISLGIGSNYSHSAHAMNQHSIAPNSPSKWPEDPRLVYNGVVDQKDVFSLNSVDSSVHRLPTSVGDRDDQDASVASFSMLDYKGDTQAFPKAITSEVQHCSKSSLAQQLPVYHSNVPSGSYSLSSIDQSILSPLNAKEHISRQESASLYPQTYGSLSTYNRGSASAGSLSTLQNTLVQCGHLAHADALKHEKEREKISHLLKDKKKVLKKHSIWLQHAEKSSKHAKDDRIPSHHLGTEEFASVSTMSSDGVSLPINKQRDLDYKKGLVSDEHRVKGPKIHMDNGLPFPKLKDLIKRDGSDVQSYSSQLANHLIVPQVEANPFRHSKSDRLPQTSEFNAPFSYLNSNAVRGAKNEDKDIMLSKRNKDKRIYGRGDTVKKVGEFTAIITSQDPRDNQGRGLATVKKDGVMKALTKIAKSALFAYDTRIVETGALLMALQDSKNVAPGLASVLKLHRRFVDAASTNPNTWLLHTRQMILVLNDVVPWLGVQVANRLMAAYDPKRSGVVRYIRVSCSVIAASKPAMMNLMAEINPEFHSQTHPGELFLLRLMLSLYEECDGFQENVGVKPVSGVIAGKGIRIEDIIELLSCCCCSIDDQIRMADHGGRVAQHLFDLHMNEDISFDPKNTKRVPLGVANKAVQDAAFEAAAKSTDKPNPDKYGPYSDVASMGQQMAIASGAWQQGNGGGIVKENEDDPDAPELAIDYYGRLTKSAALKERSISMSAKFGLPLPTTHLEYLNEEKENEQRRAMLGMEAVNQGRGGGNGSVVSFDESYSLFLGGESLWSDTSAGLTKMEENIRADGKMTATKFLNHKTLKGLRKLPYISQDELLGALSAHFPEVLDEFARQITRFRELTKPYALNGSVTFEDSVAQQSSYGTRMTDKKDMVVDLHTPRGLHEQANYDFYGLHDSPDNSSIASRNTLPTFSSNAPSPMKSSAQLAQEDEEMRKEQEETVLAVQELEREKALARPLTTPMKYAVGERIMGLYIDKWYPGTVEKVNRPAEPEQTDGESGKSFNERLEQFKEANAKGEGYTYDVRYDDGDFEKGMLPRKIQKDLHPRHILTKGGRDAN